MRLHKAFAIALIFMVGFNLSTNPASDEYVKVSTAHKRTTGKGPLKKGDAKASIDVDGESISFNFENTEGTASQTTVQVGAGMIKNTKAPEPVKKTKNTKKPSGPVLTLKQGSKNSEEEKIIQAGISTKKDEVVVLGANGKPVVRKLSQDDPDADELSTQASSQGTIVTKRTEAGKIIYVLDDEEDNCVAFNIAPKTSVCTKFGKDKKCLKFKHTYSEPKCEKVSTDVKKVKIGEKIDEVEEVTPEWKQRQARYVELTNKYIAAEKEASLMSQELAEARVNLKDIKAVNLSIINNQIAEENMLRTAKYNSEKARIVNQFNNDRRELYNRYIYNKTRVGQYYAIEAWTKNDANNDENSEQSAEYNRKRSQILSQPRRDYSTDYHAAYNKFLIKNAPERNAVYYKGTQENLKVYREKIAETSKELADFNNTFQPTTDARNKRNSEFYETYLKKVQVHNRNKDEKWRIAWRKYNHTVAQIRNDLHINKLAETNKNYVKRAVSKCDEKLNCTEWKDKTYKDIMAEYAANVKKSKEEYDQLVANNNAEYNKKLLAHKAKYEELRIVVTKKNAAYYQEYLAANKKITDETNAIRNKWIADFKANWYKVYNARTAEINKEAEEWRQEYLKTHKKDEDSLAKEKTEDLNEHRAELAKLDKQYHEDLKKFDQAHRDKLAAFEKKYQDETTKLVSQNIRRVGAVETDTSFEDRISELANKIPVMQSKVAELKRAASAIRFDGIKQFKNTSKSTPIYKDEMITYCAKHSFIKEETEELKCMSKDNSNKVMVCGEEVKKDGKCKPIEVHAATICTNWILDDGIRKCEKSKLVLPKRECVSVSENDDKCDLMRTVSAGVYCKEFFDNGVECKTAGFVWGEDYEIKCTREGKDGVCFKYGASLKEGRTAPVQQDLYIVDIESD